MNHVSESKWASQMVLEVKNPSADAGDTGLIPELGRSPGGGHDSTLQYSCLENSMDRRALWAIVLGTPKNQMWLNF